MPWRTCRAQLVMKYSYSKISAYLWIQLDGDLARPPKSRWDPTTPHAERPQRSIDIDRHQKLSFNTLSYLSTPILVVALPWDRFAELSLSIVVDLELFGSIFISISSQSHVSVQQRTDAVHRIQHSLSWGLSGEFMRNESLGFGLLNSILGGFDGWMGRFLPLTR